MKKTSIAIVVTAVISCGIMALIDGVIQPGYAVKSAVKLALFLGIPFILSRFDRSTLFFIAFANLILIISLYRRLVNPLIL